MKKFLEKKQNPKINNFRIGFICNDCNSEILVARYDSEFDILDLRIYPTDTSLYNNMTWWQTLIYFYTVIRYGKQQTNQIILNRTYINELKGFLSNI